VAEENIPQINGFMIIYLKKNGSPKALTSRQLHDKNIYLGIDADK
jgi:hypothetical protein